MRVYYRRGNSIMAYLKRFELYGTAVNDDKNVVSMPLLHVFTLQRL